MMEESEHNPKKRKLMLSAVALSFALIAAVLFLLWLLIWRFEVKTDDAYVHGNQVVVTPQIAGHVTSISVNDTDRVHEGRVLIQLDPVDRRIALQSAKNTLANTVREVAQMFEEVGRLRGQKEANKAMLAKASEDYNHRKKLVESGGVSKEDFQHSEAAFIAAFADLLSTQHALRGALAQVENTTLATHPQVEKAKDAVREAYVNLQRCTIRSPATGIVAMKRVQVGESVAQDTPLLMVAPLDQIWVEANFKENKLKDVRLGQPVTMTSDLYGSDVQFHGKVVGIGAATGSVLSVLPPQNATGNWIKIVQRLPVRIQLHPDEVLLHPLRLGLSMHVSVDIRNTSGEVIPKPPPPGPLYQTTIFAKEEQFVEQIIREIVEKNSRFSFQVGEEDG